jgi:hypothetical protein
MPVTPLIPVSPVPGMGANGYFTSDSPTASGVDIRLPGGISGVLEPSLATAGTVGVSGVGAVPAVPLVPPGAAPCLTYEGGVAGWPDNPGDVRFGHANRPAFQSNDSRLTFLGSSGVFTRPV